MATVKTWNGVPWASVKTVNGIPVASVKSINGVSAAAWVYYSTAFDGTNDHMTGALTVTDSKEFTCSFWINLTGGNTVNQVITQVESSAFLYILKDTTGRVEFRLYNSTPTLFLRALLPAGNTVTDANGWHHIYFSVDMTSTASRFVFFDNIDVSATTTWNTYNNDTSSLNGRTFYFGSTHVPSARLNANICEFWLDMKYNGNAVGDFYSGGHPVDLGADGSTPTGTQPLIYLKNPYTSFEVNAGSGGNFTVVGALTAGASIP